MDWNSLKSVGWIKKEFLKNGTKCIFYLTPIQNGVQRRIKCEGDLKDNEKCLSRILFPQKGQSASLNSSVIDQPSSSQTPDRSNTIPVSDSDISEAERAKCPNNIQPPTDIQRAANCLVPDSTSVINLDQCLTESLKNLNNLCNNFNSNYSVNARQLLADVTVALSQNDNPFKQFPWNTSENIFSKIIDFGIKYTPDLIRKVIS